MAAKLPFFSPKQVAQSLNVSESSIKRWCDQGAIVSIKTTGGHRRISLDALHDFLASSNRSLVHPKALGVPVLSSQRRSPIPGDQHPIRMEFRQALAKGDQQRCEALMTQWLIDGASRCETADTLITDAMHGIGQAWRSGSLDVYQERIACAVCLRLIHFLKSALPTPAADAPLALGGTLLGDQYEIPTTLVDLTLYEQGWNTLNLGASLPAESFAQAAHDHSPALIWLSVSSIDDPTTFIADQNRLADAIGEDVSLVVGGNALTDAIRPHLRYTAHCDSLGHLMQLTAMIKNRHGQS